MAFRYFPFNFAFQICFKSYHTFLLPLFSIICFVRMSILRPQHKQHTVSPTILFNHLHVFFLSHQFVYFNKAAFCASSVGDSFSCVRDGTLWQTLDTAMMQPLHLDKSFHCCPVKASCPRHAIVHKDHILHYCAPQTRLNPISCVIPSGGKRLLSFQESNQTFDSDYKADFFSVTLICRFLTHGPNF